MHLSILILNLVASIASVGWALAGLVRPGILSKSAISSSGDVFYGRMYAARAIPFGLLAGILPFVAGGTAAAWVLFTAAIIQVADVWIGLSRKERGMALGALAGVVIHLLCGWTIL